MPLYNVEVTKTTIMVVDADDEEDAYFVSKSFAKDAFSDDYSDNLEANVLGEITSDTQLRDGWGVDCIPYAYGPNTTIQERLGK